MKSSIGRLRRTIVWLSRIGRCRGFGIQSPWAYRFVCEVVNGRRPYSEYADVEAAERHLSPVQKKMGRLYMRLSRSLKPAVAVVSGGADKSRDAYLRAGGGTVDIAHMPQERSAHGVADFFGNINKVQLLCLEPCGEFRTVFRECLSRAAEDAVFVIEGIGYDKEARRMWREEVLGTAGTVTFDLYYCGLVCFKPKLYSRNYVVNF